MTAVIAMDADQIGRLGSGGISIALGILCVLYATGVLKLSKNEKEQRKKQGQLAPLMWICAAGLFLMGVLRIAGVMPG